MNRRVRLQFGAAAQRLQPGHQSVSCRALLDNPVASAVRRGNPGAGSAIYKAENLEIEDYGNLNNAFSGAAGIPASVSFEVRWSGADKRVSLHDEDAGFAAEFVRGKAQMQWSAVVGDYRFTSDPLNTSSSDFAEIGTMRNGTFFPQR